MILPFSEHFNKNHTPGYSDLKTLFVPKIWKGLLDFNLISQSELNHYVNLYRERFGELNLTSTKDIPIIMRKIHTIRKDQHNRWQTGNKIHYTINNRTKQSFQFAPVIRVKSIQPITIFIDKSNIALEVDNKPLTKYQLIELARNDGFDNMRDFHTFFYNQHGTVNTPPLDYKLIHWTSFEY